MTRLSMAASVAVVAIVLTSCDPDQDAQSRGAVSLDGYRSNKTRVDRCVSEQLRQARGAFSVVDDDFYATAIQFCRDEYEGWRGR